MLKSLAVLAEFKISAKKLNLRIIENEKLIISLIE